MKLSDELGVSGFPVIANGTVAGIVTGRDVRFETRMDLAVREMMTPAERLAIVARFSDVLGKSKIPVLDLVGNYEQLAKFVLDLIKPEFASRLVESALERGFTPPLDRSLDATLLGLQTATMDRLLSRLRSSWT